VREALRTADEATASAIEQAVRKALSDRIEHDQLTLGASALIVTART
jgi:membrane-associated HD superfamily phosphohydrolase